jgi:thioredoxin-like negative regulator of GroEL
MFNHRLSTCLLLYSVVSTPTATLSSATAEEVQWRTNYSLARKEALAKNRPLLLDFGTEACSWCKRLDATTFRNGRVVELVNQRFIPLKVDADRDARLTEALRIQNLPTLVLASPDGKVLETLEGYLEAGRLYDELERVLAGLTAKPLVQSEVRVRQARVLLTQAREDCRTGQYLCCLDRCERLATSFADLPEAVEGMQLAAAIKNNPEWLQQACASLADRLSGLYLALAETFMKQDQPEQAARYLERVLQSFPGTAQAETARVRLSNLHGRPAGQAEFTKP